MWASRIFKSYQREFGLDYTVFRFFNTYGPKQSIDFVISKFIRAAQKNEDITIYGDGMQTRTFCYIDDHSIIGKLYIRANINHIVHK